MDTLRHNLPADWPLPTELLTELGRMTALWGSLEALTVIAIGKLSGYEDVLDRRCVITSAHYTFQQKIDAISSLAEHLKPEFPSLGGYETTIRLLKAAQKGRNKFSHNTIYSDENTKALSIAYATARGKLSLHVENVYPADVIEVSAKIHEAICSLHNLIANDTLEPIWKRT